MYEIKDLSKAEYDSKSYVHFKAWHETYEGLMPDEYLNRHTYDSCAKTTEAFPNNTLIALKNGETIAFATYGKCRDNDVLNCGEVIAIYILKEHQGHGLGRLLMNKCIERLNDYDCIAIWVLGNNKNAISFYEHYGFKFDGIEKPLSKNYPIPCYRMILNVAK